MIRRRCCLLFAGLLLLGTACQKTDTGPSEPPAIVLDQTPIAESIDLSPFREAWQASPHGDTYDLGKGPNTYCSKCHAPRNWDPQAVIDPPPNCVSCKFSFESKPRMAAGNPLVTEAEWLDIGCDVCHRMIEGNIDPEIVWWDQAAGEYVPVADATALCGQCHTDTETIRHRRDLGNDAHATFQCTDCHDPHRIKVRCTDAGCHSIANANNPADGPIPTRAESSMPDPAHAALSCIACHDASGLEVGPLEEGGVWMTFRTTVLLGQSTTKPYQSHAITREVDCTRCHFEENPWGLDPVDLPEDSIMR